MTSLGDTYINPFHGKFQCSLCKMEFGRKYTAKIHLEAIHFPTDKGYVCDLCYVGFNTYNNYKKHQYGKCRRQRENQMN